jgi:hypothetical protein
VVADSHTSASPVSEIGVSYRAVVRILTAWHKSRYVLRDWYRSAGNSTVVAIVAGTAIFVLLALLLWHGGTGLDGSDLRGLNPVQRATAVDAFRGRIIQIGAGLLAFGAFVYTALNFRLSREGHVTDRYTKAIEQLGSERLDVRLGAIYALERIMIDSARDHPTIVEVLAAFIREHSPRVLPDEDEQLDPELEQRPSTDVLAAVTVLGRRPTGRVERGRLNLMATNLAGAQLAGARFPAVDLLGADLSYVNLSGADLTDADLTAADLTNADLKGAVLTRADFDGAGLVRTDLTGIDLPPSALANDTFREAIGVPEPVLCDLDVPTPPDAS